MVAGEHNLVVTPDSRLFDLDREAAVYGVVFRCGGMEQDRSAFGIAWGNVESGTVVRRDLFALCAPNRKSQCKQ